MARNIGTFRTGTRYKLKKERRAKGKISLSKYFQTFEAGDKVHLHAEPAIQKGMYFPRFMGRTGTIIKKRRICYEVSIVDGNKEKTLIVHPVHLKKQGNGTKKETVKKEAKKEAPAKKAAKPKEEKQ